MTVAFEIRSPFKDKSRTYRPSILTIWHVDPENFRFKNGDPKLGTRDDDSCGWFTPPYRQSDWEKIEKLATYQYGEIFARQVATREGKDYAYICNQPETTYEVIYWMWRSIKAHGKKGWMYGRLHNFLTAGELEQIMILATNPVDNFKHHQITDENSFVAMFRLIWYSYLRYNRPWYKHPRWHVNHWKLQFHPWQQLKRRYWDKCAICGKRGFKGSAIGMSWEGKEIAHSQCYEANNEPPASYLD